MRKFFNRQLDVISSIDLSRGRSEEVRIFKQKEKKQLAMVILIINWDLEVLINSHSYNCYVYSLLLL